MTPQMELTLLVWSFRGRCDSDAGMDEYLLGCYADLPPRVPALAFGSDYDLERDDALWPRPGMALQS